MDSVIFSEETQCLIGRLSEKLMVRGMHMGTAESCTGGMAAMLCTAVPGSSRWFSGAVVSYDNQLKTRLLQVPPVLLERHGAVSAPVAEAMALGALDALRVRAAVAVTGIAGPDGGTPDKPVGTVWFATALLLPLRDENGREENLRDKNARGEQPLVASFSRRFPGQRGEVRLAAALAALAALDAALR